MKHITQNDLEELRAKLEAERDELEEELASHGRVLNEEGDWGGSDGGDEGEEPDPLDAGNNIEELVTNVPLVEELEEKHTDVMDALEKMDQGIYGLCEQCGEAIPTDRLRANPSARTDVAHAE